MDFALSAELLALGAEAREVGLRAAADLAVREDSWLIGTSREFSLELAERGLAGHDLAGRGGRRTVARALERFVVFEALIGTGAPLATSWFADRQIGPDPAAVRHARAAPALPARHRRRHVGLVRSA